MDGREWVITKRRERNVQMKGDMGTIELIGPAYFTEIFSFTTNSDPTMEDFRSKNVGIILSFSMKYQSLSQFNLMSHLNDLLQHFIICISQEFSDCFGLFYFFKFCLNLPFSGS